MNLLDVVILGVVEGLTEFLPVSSTGHLILVDTWLGTTDEVSKTFSIFIQLGAMLAVVWLYRTRFLSLFGYRASREQSFSGLQGCLKLATACAPVFLLGAIAGHAIKENLFNPVTVASALIVGAIAMIYSECRKSPVSVHSVDEITYRGALFVGMIQCLALWPGMSRSASTIIGGRLVGFSRETAGEFSFLVAVPILTAATIFDLLKSYSLLTTAHVMPFGLGFFVSFVTALCAIKLFISALNKIGLVPFAVYRLILGIIVLVYLA